MSTRPRTRVAIPAARLMAEAERARRGAYAPYSRFAVGAALLTGSGRVIHGCNVENASYGLSVCAERTAIWKAVCEGERDFAAIAVTAGLRQASSPCGACRQVLHEFAPGLIVLWRGPGGRVMRAPLERLLANAFSWEGTKPARPKRARAGGRR